SSRRRHTRLVSDWSSDVCSSDLHQMVQQPLKVVADGVNALRGPEFSALVITHHQRLLDHLVPTRVHVLAGGRIVRSGGPELAHRSEERRVGKEGRYGGRRGR